MRFPTRSAVSGTRLKYFVPAVVLAALLFGFGSWAAGHLSIRSSANPKVRTSVVVSPPTALAQSLREVVYKPNLRIWMQPDGVRPARIRTSPGRVVLRVKNETAVNAVLVVEQVSPGEGRLPVARVATTSLGRHTFQSEIVLAAGEYVYYAESRPQFKGRLIVAPRD